MTETVSYLNRLLVYRNLLENDLIKDIDDLITSEKNEQKSFQIAADLIAWAEKIGISGNLAENRILYEISRMETIFSYTADKCNGNLANGLLEAAAHDINILQEMFKKGFKGFLPDYVLDNYQPSLKVTHKNFGDVKEYFSSDLSAEEIVKKLIRHYIKYGYGEMAYFRAFRWDTEKGLVGVKNVDTIVMDDIIGYSNQKEELLGNTQAFLAGKMANNVLLVGARGTGKSSSIKALINEFYTDGLRLVEVDKDAFKQLPQIMSTLRRLSKKFILFLDDLSFEEFEIEYKHLKSLIDGSMEARPENVLIYATSNRRHLIKETWDDRSGSEIHTMDTLNEKVSLSDRFGITIFYPSPNQREYFQIVEELAFKNNIDMPPKELKKRAIQWEMGHSGRSGRVAKQFIAYLVGQKDSLPPINLDHDNDDDDE
ncbi:ATP-binding protein [Selenomonadales bacterium OttesenSCG-928-I06]|nr:ATP-binding protein [Selenomonadales bacterium OttesenSCG-928-I06]